MYVQMSGCKQKILVDAVKRAWCQNPEVHMLLCCELTCFLADSALSFGSPSVKLQTAHAVRCACPMSIPSTTTLETVLLNLPS